MNWLLKPTLCLLMVAGPIATADAGIGAFLAHGVNAAAAKAGAIFGKSSNAATKASSKAASKSAGKVVSRVSSGSTSNAGGIVASASQTVLKHLGASGLAVMSKLPTAPAKRFVELSGTLAQSPHKKQWLSLISQHGAKCLDFLWEHKSGISVVAGSGAVLLAPEAFLGTIGSVATTGVNAAGQYVVKPAIDNAGAHVAKPLIEASVAGVRDVVHSPALWNLALIVLFLLAAGKLYAVRQR